METLRQLGRLTWFITCQEYNHHRRSGQYSTAPLSRSSTFPLASPCCQPSQGSVDVVPTHFCTHTEEQQELSTDSCDSITAAATHFPFPEGAEETFQRFMDLHFPLFLTLELLLGKYVSLCFAKWWQTTDVPPELVISFHLHFKVFQDGSGGTRGIVLWAVFSMHNTHGSVSYLQTRPFTVYSAWMSL